MGYIDWGAMSMMIALAVGVGLTPIYIFRTKIKEWWHHVRGK